MCNAVRERDAGRRGQATPARAGQASPIARSASHLSVDGALEGCWALGGSGAFSAPRGGAWMYRPPTPRWRGRCSVAAAVGRGSPLGEPRSGWKSGRAALVVAGGAIAAMVADADGQLLGRPWSGLAPMPLVALVLLELDRRRSTRVLRERVDALADLMARRTPSELDVARERRRRALRRR